MERIAAGSGQADDGGSDRGAAWILSVEGKGIRLRLQRDGLEWCEPDSALGYDVVRGDLATLRGTGGDFSQAARECLTFDQSAPSLTYLTDPPAGEGYWFLVRQLTLDGDQSYDTRGSGQVASRDAGIGASDVDCP